MYFTKLLIGPNTDKLRSSCLVFDIEAVNSVHFFQKNNLFLEVKALGVRRSIYVTEMELGSMCVFYGEFSCVQYKKLLCCKYLLYIFDIHI